MIRSRRLWPPVPGMRYRSASRPGSRRDSHATVLAPTATNQPPKIQPSGQLQSAARNSISAGQTSRYPAVKSSRPGDTRPPSVAAQKGQHLRGPLGRLLEGRPVPAIVEQHQARVRDVVQDRDADLEGDHAIVAPVDQ